jgi:hypothetical protein
MAVTDWKTALFHDTLLKDLAALRPVFVFGGTMKVQQTNFVADPITDAQVVIPVSHHEIHEGETFLTSYAASNVANNNSILVHILTGTGQYDHTTWLASGGGDAELEIIEGPTVDADGTPLAVIELKRADSKGPVTTAFHTPTIQADGIDLLPFPVLLPGGRGGNAQGGILRQDTEFIFKPETSYIFRLTNRAGIAKRLSIVVVWYEESNN